ncbi:MAG TPA: biotin-dependent carboxyltransferase family protein [Nocardioides sp.]|uniref:5-oxoprolinase subunit C family protein n=1 Tax=Nocardioides sp. TaxID=35761 RepID=UPI002D80D7F6|nr:biotin-dependent carboxyltransferase family protein [Nocardioides sp.]HET6654232.1 biotin-dependent carboxyltransferase family protein [Nocardioides sp.]
MTVRLRVRAPGPLSVIEDLGRHGTSGIGVGRSGAADRASLRQANRAVANPEGAAAVEVTLGGLELEAVGGPALLCVTGAPCPVTVDGRDVGAYCVFPVPEGSVVRLGPATAGLRSYVAVRGGLDVPEVLGSRSHDVMAGLGPAPLREGDELPVGAAGTAYPVVDSLPPPSFDGPVVLRAVRGPRDGWVKDPDLLVTTEWTASDKTNRVGMRLLGAELEPVDARRQLPSEGAYRGAVQVPPSGEPVVFLADHPVTGGYPVVAVVVDEDVDRAAQVRPGQALTFRWVEAP